jgi:hypothetical protein
MAKRKPKSKLEWPASLTHLLPADVAAVVLGEEIDLTGLSPFFARQAENAALFGGIVQVQPGIFTLKSPFKESFIGSLHAYNYVNMAPVEKVAYSLIRHAKWYLNIHDVDALKLRAGTSPIKPQALKDLPATWIQGIVKPTGEFTRDPEADGNPVCLAWHDSAGEIPSFAIEIRGTALAEREPDFRRTLLQSMVDFLAVELRLKRSRSGRPHLETRAESAAYSRDHERAGRLRIAQALCLCGGSHHTQRCFDRLNKLADSFYRTQQSQFGKLVREHARKYQKVKQESTQE